MMYKIEYIKLTTTWLKEEAKEDILFCLENNFDYCNECEFTKQNFIDALTAYVEHNPFTTEEICDFIKYAEIDITLLIGGETSLKNTIEQMIKSIVKDLVINAKIYLEP